MASVIDRTRVRAVFKRYTGNYDKKDDKIRLKVVHTYRVAELCDRIADSIGLTGEDKDIAWLLGMLHDLGRFEQVRRFDSFMDAETVDHAKFGADLLFGPEPGSSRLSEAELEEGPLIENLVPGLPVHPDCAMIERAIRAHNDFRLPEGLSERETVFCNIIRDADKIDIFRVNLDFPLEHIYNCSVKELKKSRVADKVMQAVEEERCVLRADRKTAVDQVVGQICLTFELYYPVSLKIAWEQGYLKQLMDFESDNEETRKQFAYIREKMADYMKRKLS